MFMAGGCLVYGFVEVLRANRYRLYSARIKKVREVVEVGREELCLVLNC
jgi:uncharacterized OsmC-like protein